MSPALDARSSPSACAASSSERVVRIFVCEAYLGVMESHSKGESERELQFRLVRANFDISGVRRHAERAGACLLDEGAYASFFAAARLASLRLCARRRLSGSV